MKMKRTKMRDGTVWSVPVTDRKLGPDDFVIVSRGGYAALKRFGDPDPPGHPDD